MIRNGIRANGNSGCHGGQVSERTIEAVLCAVLFVLWAVAGHIVLRHPLAATGLLRRAHFEMGEGGRGIEKIHEQEKK